MKRALVANSDQSMRPWKKIEKIEELLKGCSRIVTETRMNYWKISEESLGEKIRIVS